MKNTLGMIGKVTVLLLFLILIYSTTASAQSVMLQDMDRRIRKLESVERQKELNKLAGVSSEEEKYTDRRIGEVNMQIKKLEQRIEELENRIWILKGKKP